MKMSRPFRLTAAGDERVVRVFDLPQRVEDASALLGHQAGGRPAVVGVMGQEMPGQRSNNSMDPTFLVRSITTVRNNLFHGGKEIEGPLAERDRHLIQNSLLLLVQAIRLEPSVRRAFGELPPEDDFA